MKKVLIITYYWPPSGGAGVQRWLKFAKYLRGFGWEPIVYTPENPEAPAIDNSLLKDVPENLTVIKRPIWEPYSLYKKITGKKKESKINRDVLSENKKLSLTEKFAVWLRGNIFIPDARRFWIKPSVRFLTKYLKSNPVDVIVSTGPPHSMHLIALGLKKKINIPWLSDFRDTWTTMDYFKNLNMSSWGLIKHQVLELEVLTKADRVISVGNGMKQEFDEKRKSPTDVITNGFDEDDFEVGDITLSDDFTILHLGSFLEYRNPISFWSAVTQLLKENNLFKQKLKIKLIGRVESTVLLSIKKYGLEEFVQITPYIEHQKAIIELKQSQVLLLPIDNFEGAKWVLSGKLFEYLAAERPILCIGPLDGDAASVLSETGAGNTFNFDDVNGIKNKLSEYFNLYLNHNLTVNSSAIQKYSREQLTKKLAGLLNEVIR